VVVKWEAAVIVEQEPGSARMVEGSFFPPSANRDTAIDRRLLHVAKKNL